MFVGISTFLCVVDGAVRSNYVRVRYLLVAQLEPASQVCGCLKPASPLRDGEVGQLKPPSPLRVRNGGFGVFSAAEVMCPGYCGECLRPDWRFGMSGQRKYSMELRERATRMALEARADPSRRKGAIKRIGGQLGVNPEALRTWVRAVEQGGRNERGEISDQEARIRALEAENRELRRANEILKAASAFFGAELDRLGR